MSNCLLLETINRLDGSGVLDKHKQFYANIIFTRLFTQNYLNFNDYNEVFDWIFQQEQYYKSLAHRNSLYRELVGDICFPAFSFIVDNHKKSC